MVLPILANVEWPSAIDASVLIVCLTAGFIAAVMRYNSEAAMKLAGYFTGFLGLLLGMIMTYFFTQGQVRQQVSERKSIETALQASEEQRVTAAKQVSKIAAQLKSHESPESRQVVEYLEFLAKDLQPSWTSAVHISPSPRSTTPYEFSYPFKKNTVSPSPSASP